MAPAKEFNQFMVEPRYATQHVLKYLHGTFGHRSSDEVELKGYTNFDWAVSAKDSKSSSRYCFNLSFIMISWMSKKQTSITLNTAKAEFIAAWLVS